jgi:hypothetical protein
LPDKWLSWQCSRTSQCSSCNSGNHSSKDTPSEFGKASAYSSASSYSNGTLALFGPMHFWMKHSRRRETVKDNETVNSNSNLRISSKILTFKNSASSLHSCSRTAWPQYHSLSSSTLAVKLGLKKRDCMAPTSTRLTNQYSSTCSSY